MRYFDDPCQMTSEQRCSEIATILAAGLLRLKKHAESSPETQRVCNNLSKSSTSGLEVPGETRLTVRAG